MLGAFLSKRRIEGRVTTGAPGGQLDPKSCQGIAFDDGSDRRSGHGGEVAALGEAVQGIQSFDRVGR